MLEDRELRIQIAALKATIHSRVNNSIHTGNKIGTVNEPSTRELYLRVRQLERIIECYNSHS